MIHRSLTGAIAVLALIATRAEAQKAKEPSFEGRPLSSWIADLKATAPQTRNAAAYAISGMGPAAKAAVPALVEALKDETNPAVRFPVCVALREIGPEAREAVPALTEALDDRNDDVAAMARKAIRAITGVDPRPPENE
jgi:HEAT repeat protein